MANWNSSSEKLAFGFLDGVADRSDFLFSFSSLDGSLADGGCGCVDLGKIGL